MEKKTTKIRELIFWIGVTILAFFLFSGFIYWIFGSWKISIISAVVLYGIAALTSYLTTKI